MHTQKHKEIIAELKESLGENYSKITKVIKSTVSGTNIVSIKFNNEEDLISAQKLIKLNCSKCMPRYGIGLIVNGRFLDTLHTVIAPNPPKRPFQIKTKW